MNPEKIAFYKPYVAASACEYVTDVLSENHSLFRGKYNGLCSHFIRAKYNSLEIVFTSSCTDALTMCTLILNLKQGDEVILPAYTFASVASVFVSRGIHIRLADSQPGHPNMDPESFSSLISPRTRAVVFMSYGGQSKGIEQIVQIAKENNIYVIEDAAHSFDSFYQNKYTGTFGDLAAFSFHETKSVSCGQGGMLLINNPALVSQAKTIRDHGTNRWQVQEGLVHAYHWTSLGGEFNLPELSAAFLYAQLHRAHTGKAKRRALWYGYYRQLLPQSQKRFFLPDYDKDSNFYIFYIVLKNQEDRDALISYLKTHQIDTAFHYTGLHRSPYFQSHFDEVNLPNADRFSNGLVRLPLYPQLAIGDIERVCTSIEKFYTTVYDSLMVQCHQ